MQIIDMHCDTLMKIFKDNKKHELYQNNFSVDIQKLQKGHSLAQFFAAFVYKKTDCEKYGYSSLFDLTLDMINCYHNEIEKNKKLISTVYSYNDIEQNMKNNKISAILTLEEGGIIEDKLFRLEILYRLGVRLITLTWNFPNSIGYPNQKYSNMGLTDFGKTVVRKMQDMGLIVDVSHLSDKGFYDVYNLSKKPFVASHSNARSIKNHARNLTDDMIRKIAEKGGLIGLNFASSFLADSKKSKISDMIKHLKYIKNIGGLNVVAFGTDFDGISCNIEIEDFSKMPILINEMKKNGFSEKEIEKIAYKNVLRVLKDTL